MPNEQASPPRPLRPPRPAADFGGQAFGGAAFAVLLPGVPGLQDPLVADDEHGDVRRIDDRIEQEFLFHCSADIFTQPMRQRIAGHGDSSPHNLAAVNEARPVPVLTRL